MRKDRWFLQDEENGGNGGGGGGISAADARAFVADFAHDPKAVEGMDDAAAVAYHGRITAALDKARPQGKWPDTWRKDFAGDDDKAMKRLERFQSPGDVFKSYRALESKVSSGELKPNVPYPDKGTVEEQKVWRAERGLPESHDKYDLKLPQGFVIGEADKPIVDAYLKDAFEAHIPPDLVSRNVQWFFKNRDQQLAAAKEAEAEHLKGVEDELRNEWGGDFRKNWSQIDGLLAETVADEDLRNDLSKAAKGNPGFAKWMLGMQLSINPASTVVPGSGATQTQALSDELAKLEKMMGDHNSDYWKGPSAEKNQARYRELVTARDKLKKAA